MSIGISYARDIGSKQRFGNSNERQSEVIYRLTQQYRREEDISNFLFLKLSKFAVILNFVT